MQNSKTKNTKTCLIQFQLFNFYKPAIFHPGIFRGQEVWAGSVCTESEKKKKTSAEVNNIG